LHLIGLVSNGGVHSHTTHLKAIVDAAEKAGLKKVFIHAFTDGRDCDPKSGLGFITNLQQHIAPTHAKIATIIGDIMQWIETSVGKEYNLLTMHWYMVLEKTRMM
jgi:2,3-bisphosphoglycerate-independent phosphoglycerate mutase